MTLGRTIKLYLADGHPAGLIVAEILNWTGKVLSFPRGLLPQVMKSRPELAKTGVYFLVGTDPDNPFRSIVYVGESDDITKRLAWHDKDDSKEFFEQVALVISKDENLTKAHARYLEARLIEIIGQQGAAHLKNGNLGQPVSLPESDVADMEYFLHQIRAVLPVLGLTFLQELPKRPAAKPVPQAAIPYDAHLTPEFRPIVAVDSPFFELTLANSAIQAEAYEAEGQFIVKAGAVCRHPDYLANSFTEERFGYVINDLKESLTSGVLAASPDLPEEALRLTRDKTFKSPSTAAMFVCGSSKNGRTYWKIKGTSQTYGEWREAQLTQSTALEEEVLV